MQKMQKLRGFITKAGAGCKAFSELFYAAPIRFTALSSLILNFMIEILCRHSLIEAIKFIFTHPLMFVSGWIILLFTASFSWFMTKGVIMWATVTVVWLGFGIANSIILLYRAMPLTGSDFAILRDVLPIITVYLNIPQLILISIGIVGVITGIVTLWIKAPAKKVNVKRQLIKFGGFTASLAVLVPVLAATEVLPRDFSEINKAYMDYGFPYAFSSSLFVHGIPEPDGYSPEDIQSLLDRIEGEKEKDAEADLEGTVRPNVIYVQLESFFDLNLVKWLEVSEDPSPN